MLNMLTCPIVVDLLCDALEYNHLWLFNNLNGLVVVINRLGIDNVAGESLRMVW